MGRTLSLDKGVVWRTVLGTGLLLTIFELSTLAVAAPVDTSMVCSDANRYSTDDLIDLNLKKIGGLQGVVSKATEFGTLFQGQWIICFALKDAEDLKQPLALTATAEAPLVIIGLKSKNKGLTLSGSHVTLQDAEITVGAGAAITMTGSHHALHNITLNGEKQAGSYGVQASGATSVVIEHSLLENFDRGIVVGGQSQVTDTIVRWHYDENLLSGKAATGTEALQLLGTKSLVTTATIDGYATGVALSDAEHVIKGSSVVAYPYEDIPTSSTPAQVAAIQDKLEQHPGLDGVLITGSAHQLIPLVTEVDGTQHTTRNTITGFATGIYLDGSATIRDNDITALQVGIQSDTVPTQASVLYPNRFIGDEIQPYAFATEGQPKDVTALKLGKVCTVDMTWPSESAATETVRICDEAVIENSVSAVAASLPQSYCDGKSAGTQIVLYEHFSQQEGQQTTWLFEPRGVCAIGPLTAQTFLIKDASHETMAQGTCSVWCDHQDTKAPLSLKMETRIYPVFLAPPGAFPLLAADTTVASLFNLGLKTETTVPGVGVTMTPTGGGEPGLVATGTDTGNLAAGGEITEVATASSDDEASKAGVIDGSGVSGEALGTGLVSAGSGGGMTAGCSLVLP